MKSIQFLAVCFIFFGLATKPFFSNPSSSTAAAAASESDPVLDAIGRPVEAGVAYFMEPILKGNGGIVPYSVKNDSCFTDIVVGDAQETLLGSPVIFSPADNKSHLLLKSADFNIKFDFNFNASLLCEQNPGVTTTWKVNSIDPSTGKRFLSIDGVEGNPGPQTLTTWFKFDKAGSSSDYFYKLVYCPTVCATCKPVCGDVGIYKDNNGVRRLALTNAPLKYDLIKVRGDLFMTH